MREQADRVEDALNRRVAETEEAVRHLEIELKEVICFEGRLSMHINLSES